MLQDIIKDVRAQGVEKVNFISLFKALFLNQAVQMLVLYRVARIVVRVPLVGGILSQFLAYVSQVITSCHVSIYANIAPGCYFPHPTGICIGEGCILESGVTIYQNVTIGRKKSKENLYPVIRKNACLYAGAVVIGGLEVAEHAIVAANSVVTNSVGRGLVVGGIPAKVIDRSLILEN